VRVVQNRDLLQRLNNSFVEYAKGKELKGSAARAQEPDFSVFHHAPTLIIVAADRNNPYSAVDCGLLAENILLSAAALGLGTCIIGNMSAPLNAPGTEALRDELRLPNSHHVVFGIALGYKNEAPVAKTRDLSKVQIIC
jgi:nitroreductase